MTITTTARNLEVDALKELLLANQLRKVDVVAPATAMRFKDGNLVLAGMESELSEDGVTLVDGVYAPTQIFNEDLAERLHLGVPYARRMAELRPDIYTATANAWLGGKAIKRAGGVEVIHEPDPRSFLLRLYSRGDEQVGMARSWKSDSFATMDNYDLLIAAMDGIRQAGVIGDVVSCDLSERRMVVKIKAPEISAFANTLMAGYRSPYSGNVGTDNSLVFAGIMLSNSETGNGMFTVAPRLIFDICSNGAVMTKDAMAIRHVGGKLEQNTVVRWSHDTENRNYALITGQARDSVKAFLSQAYLAKAITSLEATASAPVSNPIKTIETVTKALHFTEAEGTGILEHFIRGGQLTAGGVMQAVTSYVQQVTNPDAAYRLENSAVRAMQLVAASR